MKLSLNNNAQKIVEELSDVVKLNINIIDCNGYIIASTDKKREGFFHAAAKKIIDYRLPELLVRDNNEFVGAKRGINYPIISDGEILGVVGITGEYDDVVVYGRIIQRMTKMLLINYQNQFFTGENNLAYSKYLEQWLYGNLPIDHEFVSKGLKLDIDINCFRRIMAIAIRNDKSDKNDQWMSEKRDKFLEIAQYIYRSLCIDLNAFLLIKKQYLLLGVNEQSDESLQSLFDALSDSVLEKYNVALIAGVNECPVRGKQIREACYHAEEALKLAMTSNERGLKSYDKSSMEIILNEISDRVKDDYVKKVFNGCNDIEVSEMINLLEVYFSCEGSVNATANKLFMHKNTIQYKLNKIKEITGYDPRVPIGASHLYMAVQFFNRVVL